MKPAEIMSLLEEASGTRMYEKKKEKAMQTMEKKEQKLQVRGERGGGPPGIWGPSALVGSGGTAHGAQGQFMSIGVPILIENADCRRSRGC